MSDNTPQDLSDNLRKALTEANITTAELSRQSGVSLASLSRILSGQVNPSLGNMVKISKILNVSLDQLTGQPAFTSVEGGADGVRHTAPKKKPNMDAHTEVLASYVLSGTDRSPQEAARLLTNAANGTWVESWTDRLVDTTLAPQARPVVFMQTGEREVTIDMAFPHHLIEEGSITSLLSVLAAPVTSTGARISDVRVPTSLVRTFPTPAFGMRGIRDALQKYGRPLLSVTMRPMSGLSPRLYGRAVFETLKGGVDFTCDPSMMHSLPESRWRERFRFVQEAVEAASSETNELKMHVANVSAGSVEDMIERAEYVKSLSYSKVSAVMVDSAAIGWSALMSLVKWCRDNDVIVCAMGGRSLQSGILSEQVSAKMLRFSGCDVVSIGSPLRGSVSNRRHVKGIVSSLIDDDPTPQPEEGVFFEQPTCAFPSVFPACGGGHNPWHFPRLMDALGDDVIIQCGGSVMGHPWGGEAGAIANRTAVEAIVQAKAEGQSLNVDGRTILTRAARYSQELKAALEHWQEGAFLFGVIPGGEHGALGGVIKGDETQSASITPINTKHDNDEQE